MILPLNADLNPILPEENLSEFKDKVGAEDALANGMNEPFYKCDFMMITVKKVILKGWLVWIVQFSHLHVKQNEAQFWSMIVGWLFEMSHVFHNYLLEMSHVFHNYLLKMSYVLPINVSFISR